MTVAANETVCCSRCAGSGRVKLSPRYARTLAIIRSTGGLSAPDIARDMDDATTTAANNRLEKLRAWGFVTRERLELVGFVYTAAHP